MAAGAITLATQIRPVAQSVKSQVIDVAGNGDNTIVSLVANKSIRVVAFDLSAVGTVKAKFTNEGDAMWVGCFVAGTGLRLPYCEWGWFQTSVGSALVLNLSAAIAVGGVLLYTEI